MKAKTKTNLKKTAQFLLNPRLLICLAVAWFITNGWSYAMFGIGTYLKIDWMIAVSGAYLAFLWLPVSPEKLVTITIAIALLRWLFPGDEKTLAVLRGLYAKAKDKTKAFIQRKRDHRAQKKSAKSPDQKGNDL